MHITGLHVARVRLGDVAGGRVGDAVPVQRDASASARGTIPGPPMHLSTLAPAMFAAILVAGCATGVPSERSIAPDRPHAAPTARATLLSTPPPRPTTGSTLAPAVTPRATSTGTPPLTATPTATAVPLGGAPSGATERAVVLHVIDGDTIKVDRGRGPESVRYIGIDTPETVHPSQPVEWMGEEAADANRELVEGREVVLEIDVSDTDQYGRLLRYVWTHDEGGWRFVNLALLARGVAQVSTYPPDVRYVDLYLVRQAAAREAGLGLWGSAPTEPPTAPPDPARPLPPQDCHPSYPEVCIPPAPPDLDCGQIGDRRFAVIGEDPHGFDGNHDGVGCESG